MPQGWQDTLFHVNPDGTINAQFSGSVDAAGLTLPFDQTNSIIWTGTTAQRVAGQPTTPTAAQILGALPAPGDAFLTLDSQVAGAGAAILELETNTTTDASTHVRARAYNAAGTILQTKDVIRGDGSSDFAFQSLANVVPATGRAALGAAATDLSNVATGLLGGNRKTNWGIQGTTWPGGNAIANALGINHGLGNVPTAVFACPVAPADWVSYYVNNTTNVGFTINTRALTGLPGAGAGISYFWFAIL